jgi:hypothetical protein
MDNLLHSSSSRKEQHQQQQQEGATPAAGRSSSSSSNEFSGWAIWRTYSKLHPSIPSQSHSFSKMNNLPISMITIASRIFLEVFLMLFMSWIEYSGIQNRSAYLLTLILGNLTSI